MVFANDNTTHVVNGLNMIKDDDEMYDALEQIFFDEARSVEELKRLS